MQMEITLSSTEAEFVALATSTRAAVPIQQTLMEMKELGFQVITDKYEIHHSVFEDNSGALAIAKLLKMCASTKHINVKYFHSLHWTQGEGEPLSFHKITPKDQPTNMLTKPFIRELFVKHRKWLLGW